MTDRQRMAVARALAKHAQVSILDEPTANLDSRAEFEMFTAWRQMARDKTSIIVSHRFATVKSVDRIVVPIRAPPHPILGLS